jgi:hypothetical protein
MKNAVYAQMKMQLASMIIGKKGLAIFTKGEEIQAGMEDQAFS